MHRVFKRQLPLPLLLFLAFLFTFITLLFVFQSLTKSEAEKNGLWQTQTLNNLLRESRNRYFPHSTTFNLILITDLDKLSKKETYSFFSVLKYGKLIRKEIGNPEAGAITNGAEGGSGGASSNLAEGKGEVQVEYDVVWEEREVHLHSKFNHAGRGMELSELILWNGRLITCDDQSGLVAEIVNDQLIPFHILMEGDGMTPKGHKCEWMTIKDNLLYVGSTGKEWTEGARIVNQNPMWVKTIDPQGRINHLDWAPIYEKLRKETQTQFPGYILHEAVSWNERLKRWYFLPRKMSKEGYSEELDEKRGNNLLMSLNDQFSDFKMSEIGPLHLTHGFSSFKFIPFRNEMVGLKTEEVGDRVASYIVVFDLNGKILMEEKFISNQKFEGVEIV